MPRILREQRLGRLGGYDQEVEEGDVEPLELGCEFACRHSLFVEGAGISRGMSFHSAFPLRNLSDNTTLPMHLGVLLL
jgi:hypothetical protein